MFDNDKDLLIPACDQLFYVVYYCRIAYITRSPCPDGRKMQLVV